MIKHPLNPSVCLARRGEPTGGVWTVWAMDALLRLPPLPVFSQVAGMEKRGT
jgi:hypothetical protein